MKVNATVIHVGNLDVTLTRSLIRIPTRSPHCVAENDTIQTTELVHCVCYACKSVAFCLCFDLFDSLTFCPKFVGLRGPREKRGRVAFCPEASSWVWWAFLVGIYDGYVYIYMELSLCRQL